MEVALLVGAKVCEGELPAAVVAVGFRMARWARFNTILKQHENCHENLVPRLREMCSLGQRRPGRENHTT